MKPPPRGAALLGHPVSANRTRLIPKHVSPAVPREERTAPSAKTSVETLKEQTLQLSAETEQHRQECWDVKQKMSP